MKVDFWGVRGSHTCWGEKHNAIGGNTSCISVSIQDEEIPLIFDAGSGLIDLGEVLKNSTGHYHIFITHPHLDHLLGLPFFKPLWNYKNNITLHGPQNLEYIVSKMILAPPLFSVPFNKIPADIGFETMGESPFQMSDFLIETINLNHPGGSIGYKLTSQGKSICYITDHETNNHDQKTLMDFIHKTDLLIFDCMYDPQDLKNHEGWGHSSWKEGCDLANATSIKNLALYHLSPNYTDKDLLEMEKKSKKEFNGAFLAREKTYFDLYSHSKKVPV